MRRGILFFVVLAFAALKTEAQKEQPNIIVLLADDLRYDAIGYAGNEVIKTPHLDNLAKQGTYFTNGFVATPICCASRANILTGQYARNNGVPDFFNPIQLETTYPALLRTNNYYTGFIGKWGTMENNEEYFKKSADLFDYWGGSMRQSNYWHEKDCNYVLNNGTTDKHNFQCNCPPDAKGRKGEDIRTGHANMKKPVHQSTYVIPHKVNQFLDQRNDSKPFCLSISYKSPHGPWKDYDKQFSECYTGQQMPVSNSVDLEDALSRPEFLRVSLSSGKGELTKVKTKDEINGPLQNTMRAYYRLINGMDTSVGMLIKELKKRGLYENTVIIFLSDNGMFMAEHGFNGKWLMYEESVRVPFFIFDPRNLRNNVISDELIVNIDVAPTTLALAGIEIPESMDGKNLLPLLEDPNTAIRSAFFGEHHYGHGKLEKHIERSECYRTKDWKYIHYIDQKGILAEELYNLKEDPYEMNDLSENLYYTEKLNELRTQYQTFFEK